MKCCNVRGICVGRLQISPHGTYVAEVTILSELALDYYTQQCNA